MVFIDKPFPNKAPTVFDLNRKCMKTLLKTNFCDVEAFSFDNTEITIGEYRIHQTPNTRSKVKRKLEDDNVEINVKKVKTDEAIQLTPIETEEEIKHHHNVTYRLWKLQLKTEQCKLIKDKYKFNNIHLLVRCKLDGCEVMNNIDALLSYLNLLFIIVVGGKRTTPTCKRYPEDGIPPRLRSLCSD